MEVVIYVFVMDVQDTPPFFVRAPPITAVSDKLDIVILKNFLILKYFLNLNELKILTRGKLCSELRLKMATKEIRAIFITSLWSIIIHSLPFSLWNHKQVNEGIVLIVDNHVTCFTLQVS